MNALLIVSIIVLWVAVLATVFLLLGTLRSLGILTWRLEQLELTRPSRLGREGLKVGVKAPNFTLPGVMNGDVSLNDFVGCKVLLVFTQSGCGPCHDIAPELNRLHDRGEYEVLVVNNGDADVTRRWATEVEAHFPVLAQEKFAVSKRYEVFATPFAFVIDEQGVISSKGIAGSAQYLGYVLSGAGNRPKNTLEEPDSDSTVERELAIRTSAKELTHV